MFGIRLVVASGALGYAGMLVSCARVSIAGSETRNSSRPKEVGIELSSYAATKKYNTKDKYGWEYVNMEACLVGVVAPAVAAQVAVVLARRVIGQPADVAPPPAPCTNEE